MAGKSSTQIALTLKTVLVHNFDRENLFVQDRSETFCTSVTRI